MSSFYKKVVFGEELHETCDKTITLMAKAVKATLGPSGKLALIDRGEVPSLITKDGVSVCRSMLPLYDEVMNKIGEKIKEIAVKTNQEAGDGTTTSIVLAEALYKESIIKVKEGHDPVLIKKSIEEALPSVVKQLKKYSKPMKSLKDMENVATISANNDRTIGNIVAKAIESVGEDGFVSLEEGDGFEPSLELIEGLEVEKGSSSSLFLKDKYTLEFEKPMIFVFEGKLEDVQVLHNLYISYVKGAPFVVIGNLSDQCMQYLVLNNNRNIIKACHIQPPLSGEARHKMLEDICLVIDSKLANTARDNMISLDMNFLGSCEKISISMKKTTILNGDGDDQVIIEKIEDLKKEMNSCKSEYDKNTVKERIGRLARGIAIIGVDGKTDDEMKERKDRFEDSLNATRAALIDGVVSGGGSCLYRISKNMKEDTIGHQILKNAIQAPIKQIITNTGRDYKEILPQITDKKGYDARSGEFVVMEKAGIIDPTKVIIAALRNSISIVDLLINLEVLTVVIKKENPMDVLSGLSMGE